MILEMVDVRVIPERAAEFERAVADMSYVFDSAQGCHGMTLHRSLDRVGWYRFVVTWESVEAHTVVFRESAGFQRWKERVGSMYSELAFADHLALVIVKGQRP